MKFAIAGAGYIANIHARAILNNGGELSAVVEKFADKRTLFAAQFKIPGEYETLESALTTASFDALVIGTPNYLHAAQALTALNAGIAVLVEKPMAMNTQEGAQMLEVSLGSNTPLMVAHCWRFDEDVLWLKQHSSSLGRIIRTKGYGVHTNWGPAGWFTQKALAGGGALADMGIHAIDTARFLLGDPQPRNVFARIGTHYKPFDVDDTGVIFIEWENGTNSYIESGWWQPHTDGPEAATQLYGESGFGQLFPTRLELPQPGTYEVTIIDPGFDYPREEHCPQSMYDAQMRCFMESVRENRTPVPGGLEGLVNMKIVEAAYKSAASGEVVTISS